MALVKTNYGLIYNDDGSLCVTLRKDDVPFEGVASFAVEEGTTNLFTNPIFQNGESGFDLVGGWSSRTIKDGGPLGRYIELVDDSTSVGCRYGNTFNITAGQTYTFSVYINVLEWNQDGSVDLYYNWLDANDNFISAQLSATLGEERPRNFVGQGWRRYKITDTAPANAAKVRAFVYSSTAATSRIQVTGFQFEQLPFATSIVDGSRQKGLLKIPNIISTPSPFTNLVISFWIKILGFNGFDAEIINSIKHHSRDKALGIKALSASNSTFYFIIWHYADDSTGTKLCNVNEWYFVTYIRDGNISRLYVNGAKDIEYSTVDQIEILPDLVIGIDPTTCIGSKKTNFLISNLLVTSYNSSIWTAEYIQELYNMRRPFSVPPRMPII